MLERKRLKLGKIDSLLYGPVESVESQNTNILVKSPISATLKKELSKLWDVVTKYGDFLYESRMRIQGGNKRRKKKGTYENEESLEDVE